MGTFKKVAYTGPVPSGHGPAQTHPVRYLCRNLREEQNLALTHALHERVRLLRSLSIEIGAEVRYQNGLLGRLDGDLDRSDGLLHKAAARVARIARSPQHYYVLVVSLFSLACFAAVWCVVRLR